MEIIQFLIDFILHIDKHLEAFVVAYGPWVYALLFIIVFVETGVVVMPFLPGDSLMFIVGALCGAGYMSYPLAVVVLLAAAILGDQSNYTIGRYLGPKVFQWEDSRWFNRKAFDQAHNFYERYGGVTIILARFMPFIRTFAPFVAGVAHMSRAKFSMFNGRGHSVGAWHQRCGLLLRQSGMGQGQSGKNHLGLDSGAGPDCHFRCLACRPCRQGKGRMIGS